MYDSVNFRLPQAVASGVSFMEEIPCYLTNVGEHNYNGNIVITGELNGLKVVVNNYQMKVKDGSLCKWYLGNNFNTMNRRDTQMAVEKLSDVLHLPMSKAIITRIDIAQNFIMKYPCDVYLSHLGTLKQAARIEQPSSLYYQQASSTLCFYDKIKEQKKHHDAIPELFRDRNVLRYEQRYIGRLSKQLEVEEITGALLYDEVFYMGLIDRWQNKYRSINKVNDISLNFEAMGTRQQFYKMGVVALIEKAGGVVAMLDQISEAQKMGKMTKQQAYNIRKAIEAATAEEAAMTTPNEAIAELNKKIKQAVKLYK